VPDSLVVIAGQQQQAGLVIQETSVIRRALAFGPAKVHRGIMAAGVFGEEPGHGHDERVDVAFSNGTNGNSHAD
jgi:hypothetical protein